MTSNGVDESGGDGSTATKKKSSYTEVPLTLTSTQWEWLENMASKHKLSSMSKAVRCCINCVVLGDADDECHVQSTYGSDSEECITKQVELSQEQLTWLEAKQKEGGSELARKLIQTCMNMDEYEVYGIIRCKTSIAKCEGAQQAILNIGEQYNQQKNEVVVKENIDISKKCGCSK